MRLRLRQWREAVERAERAHLIAPDNALVVGVLGEVHPRVRKQFKLRKARPAYLEIDAEAIVEHVLAPQWLDEVDLLRQALSE